VTTIAGREGGKINVMIAVAGLGVGGAEVVIQSLAQTIDRSRFNLIVCCLKVQGMIGDRLVREGVEIVVLKEPHETKVNYLLFLRLRKLIRERNVRVIHTHTTDALADAAMCKLLDPRLKLLHTFHFGNYPHKSRGELWLERVFSRVATRLFAVGEAQRRQLRQVFGFSERAIGRVWNGVVFATPRDAAFRRSIGVGAEHILVGTTATLIEQKGLFDLLEVARRVTARHPMVRFVVIGDGHLRAGLEARRRELGLDQQVILAGWVADAAAVAVPALDVFFQPSLWEAMSIALLEAMAASRAIVATRVGEAPQVIDHDTNGLLVEPRDIDGMTQALSRVVADSGLRQRLGEAAAAKARGQFAVERMTRAYEQIYADVLD
jgi:glycosyltransferase involved in cell wall biosynthesis